MIWDVGFAWVILLEKARGLEGTWNYAHFVHGYIFVSRFGAEAALSGRRNFRIHLLKENKIDLGLDFVDVRGLIWT